MKILLTGATGFLGSHLARVMLEDGHEVIALKRANSSLQRLADAQKEIKFYDVENLDYTRLFRDNRCIDAVIHTATCYGRSGESRSEILECNVLFPLRLLATSASFKTNTFINTDTFFNTKKVQYSHLAPYAASKKQFAELGRQYSSDKDMRFINIRLEHMYGPSDAPSKFSAWIIDQCMRNVPEIDLTKGDQKRDFIYVDDVVRGYTTLMRFSQALRKGYLQVGLGSGYAVELRRFVESVHRLCGSNSTLNFGALQYRSDEIMASQADTSMLMGLGWSQLMDLESGISECIYDWKQRH